MMHIITLCISLAINDMPTDTTCTNIVTADSPNQVAQNYIASINTEAYDPVWHELHGNLVHVVLNEELP